MLLPLENLLGLMASRLCIAALILLGFFVFCMWIRAQHVKHHAAISAAPLTLTDDTIYIIYASQTGYAEHIALQTKMNLQEAHTPAILLSIAQCDASLLHRAKRILFIVSTTGEGDAPDQAAAFVHRIMSSTPSLAHMQFAVLALGDRHYHQFCAFGHQLENWLLQQQAQALFDLIEVDDGDEGALRHWQHHLGVLTGYTQLADWSTPDYQTWILKERHLLNKGSLGLPVFHLILQAEHPSAHWQAGDILEVLPESCTEMTTQASPLPHREYSIASIMKDAQVELVVRQMRQANGALGIGSGWLTQYAPIGSPIQCRLRSNRSFHSDQHVAAMILIGNGTGIAGLRAHLKQREEAGLMRNWLFFGERERAHDFLFQNEIQTWQKTGLLSHVDLAFSRDQAQRIYVQDQLKEHAHDIQAWVAHGAAIYVCGSLEGMAADVDATLKNILGGETLAQLKINGLYRRDVY